MRQRAAGLYRRLNAATGGAPDVFRRAIARMDKVRVAEAAAAMAYYAIFSLFPLLLALISAGSFVMQDQDALRQVVDFVSNAIPVSRDLIETNIQSVLQLRGPVGIIGLLGLAWSGSGFFTALALHVSRAWPAARPHGFLRRRLVAFAMVGSLALLLLLSVIAGAVLQVVSCEQAAALGIPLGLCESVLWAASARLAPWMLTFMAFLALYRWTPRADVPWRAAALGALVSSILWQAATFGFTLYLNRWAGYELVYGSLGAVVALLFWMYLSNMIVLFGAHLSAASEWVRRRKGEAHAEGDAGSAGRKEAE
jgi:membrane protein